MVLVVLWSMMFERARHEDKIVLLEAQVNHGNVAQAVANHTDLLLEHLRFYSTVLVHEHQDAATRALVRTAVGADSSVLRLMLFDASGQIKYTTGASPEPWLKEAALAFAAQAQGDPADEFTVGAMPPAAAPQAWSLPIFHRPVGAQGKFLVTLLDLGSFPKRFANIDLGQSGKIVLVAKDGRELISMHGGRLDAVESIAGSPRHVSAFATDSGSLSERIRDAHDRLFAHRRIKNGPLAVLVSRTHYDLLIENKSTQRGYWLSTLLLSGLMLFFAVTWHTVAHRQRDLLGRLAAAQIENTQLIQQLEEEKRAAYQLATHDKLTGLPNRILFAEIAGRLRARAIRLRRRFGIMFIDLDRFKPINDNHGHHAGDQLLIEVSNRLSRCVRDTDVISRFGGDEFVALVTDLHSSKDAGNVAAKIIESLSQPFTGIVASDLFVTPSIGIALYPDDASEIEALVRQADAAMYEAKAQGRATLAFANPAMNRRNQMNSRIEAELPAAIRNGDIKLHYQPKVSLDDSRLTGLEALARWNHSELGAISPADFIAVAEKSGAIVELGEHVIREACRQMEAWWRAGVPLVPVAVNISPRQLGSPRLMDHIVSLLEQHAIAPRLFEIEITETGLIEARQEFLDVLHHLDGQGIHLSIDDFGTGFSGLSHLRHLPVKTLKIDRSFISNIRNDINDATIVTSTIALAHNLRMKVIAEGVETVEQVVYLKAAHCDEVQGYFYSPPLPPEEIEALLRAGCCHTKLDTQGERAWPDRPAKHA
jgi:diguanylate cyclase (GGDEF)-like protein